MFSFGGRLEQTLNPKDVGGGGTPFPEKHIIIIIIIIMRFLCICFFFSLRFFVGLARQGRAPGDAACRC